HELGHARYLLDVYAFAVQDVPPRYRVDIKENGSSVVGTLMPGAPTVNNNAQGFREYESADSGLMASDYTWIDRQSAAAMNLIAGARAVDGTANVPGNYAAYVNDLPAQNRITVLDPAGRPIANADVDLFQGVPVDENQIDSYLTRVYDNTSDLHFRTNGSGQFLAGRNPFTHGAPLDGYRE